MKTLIEIQQELDALAHSVYSVANRIKDVREDIDTLRKDTQNINVDYVKLNDLARGLSFGQHPLSRLPDRRLVRLYLEMLLNIVRLDPNSEGATSRLVFIQWLQIQVDSPSIKELLAESFQADADSYGELLKALPVNVRKAFITDTLLIANIGGTPSHSVLEYIAGLGTVLGIGENELREIAKGVRRAAPEVSREIALTLKAAAK